MRPFPCGLSYLQTVGTSAFFQHATIFPRLAINLIYFRSRVTFCCTVFQSLSHVVVLFGLGAFCQHCQLHWVVFTTTEVFTAVFLTAGNAVWERFVHGQIRADIETAATQSEAMASRRLLNTMCDATFELDDKLCITGEAAQLAGMLHLGIHRCLRGTQVESFVLQVDRELFRSRITAPVPENQEMANVFRVRFCDSLSNVIDVEVFHVPLPRPLAGAPPRHLVGLRERVDWGDTFDSESSISTTSSRHSQSSGRASRRSSRQSPRARATLPAELLGPGGPCRPGASASTADPAGARGFEPLVVKFDADSLGILAASGPGAEACVPGACLADLLRPGQDFFMDLEVGREALRDMLIQDAAASFQYHSSVVFCATGPTRKSLCKVTLAAAERASGTPGPSEAPPLAATLRTVRALPPRPAAPPA